jgi:mannan endo-1,4-beta-mannosidase
MFRFASLIAIGGLIAGCAGLPKTRQSPQGFVTTNGNNFQLDGEEFHFAGSNAYYFPFSGVSV